MKRTTYLLMLPLLVLMTQGASCPPPDPSQPQDPYAVAKFTINIMHGTIKALKVGFDAVASAQKDQCTEQLCRKLHPDVTKPEYRVCLTADHSTVAEFQKCWSLGQVKPWVDKGVVIGLEACSAAKDAVALAAQLAAVRENKQLKEACAGGDQKACDQYNKQVDKICSIVDPLKGDAYKACVEGKPVGKADWQSMLKRGACLTYAALLAVPANPKSDLYINAAKMWLKAYGGCTAK